MISCSTSSNNSLLHRQSIFSQHKAIWSKDQSHGKRYSMQSRAEQPTDFQLNTSYNYSANLSCSIESLCVTQLSVLRSHYVMRLLERMSRKCEASSDMPKVIAGTSTDAWHDHQTLIVITHNHLNREDRSALQLRGECSWSYSRMKLLCSPWCFSPSCRNVVLMKSQIYIHMGPSRHR